MAVLSPKAWWTYYRSRRPNFHVVVAGHMLRSATPTPEDLKRYKTYYGLKTWVDLRMPKDYLDDPSFFAAQCATATSLEIKRISFPLDDFGTITDEQVQTALALMGDSTKWPMLWACRGGRHRAGKMIALFRLHFMQWTGERAYDEAKDVGGYYASGHKTFDKRFRQLLGLTLALLLCVTPALGQGRFVLTDGSTQSEYGVPAADRNVICPVCSDKGERSTVRRWTEPTTYGFSYTPSINYYKSENRYWDEDGKYHDHELAQESLVCSSGHRFTDFDDRRCWCEWPHGRYVVVEPASREGNVITLPPGTTWQDFLVTPAAPTGTVTLYDLNRPVTYQHPFIQPGPSLPLQDSVLTRTDKDSLTVAPAKFDRSFWLASSLWLGGSAADLTTTKFALDRGGIERNPIHARDGGHKLRWTTAIAATGGTLAFAAYCERKGHRRIARGVLIAGAVLRTGLAFWNNSRSR